MSKVAKISHCRDWWKRKIVPHRLHRHRFENMRSTAATNTETTGNWNNYAYTILIKNIVFSLQAPFITILPLWFIVIKSQMRLDAYPSPSNRIVVSPNMRTTNPTVVFSLQSMPSKHDSSISFTLFACWWCCSCDTWLMIFRLVKSFSLISGFVVAPTMAAATALLGFRIGLGAALLLVGYSLQSLWLFAWDLSLLTCWAVIKLLKCCCWWDIGAVVVVALAAVDVVVVVAVDGDDDAANFRWACFRVHDTTTKYRVRPHRVLSNLTACKIHKFQTN